MLESFHDEFLQNRETFAEKMATEYNLNMMQKMKLISAFRKLGK